MTDHEPHILTYTGRLFHPTRDDDVDEIDIEDIAVGLSAEPRYNGHTALHGSIDRLYREKAMVPVVYVVADHSVRVMELGIQTHPDLGLEFLLHDATEAYLKDIPKPVKNLLPDYQLLERRVEARIRKKFQLRDDALARLEVKRADRIMLLVEQRSIRSPLGLSQDRDAYYRQLVIEEGHDPEVVKWANNIPFVRAPRSPKEAYEAFMLAFHLLTATRKDA